jgi:hypothetical protein
MNSFFFTYNEFQYILERLSQFYIANEDFLPFIQQMNYAVPLNNYLCFCYGADYSGQFINPRKIEVFQFIGQISKSKGYYVQSYDLPDIEQLSPSEMVKLTAGQIYHITDCNQLRQRIFQFHDKTSLFRSTLFYVPCLKKLYRIHCLMSFLTLPEYEMSEVCIDESTSLDSLHSDLITPQKFLIPLRKKKQILDRLQQSLNLCELTIKAHGSLEQSVPQSDDQK